MHRSLPSRIPLANNRGWLQRGVLLVVMLSGAGNLVFYPVTREESSVGIAFLMLWSGVLVGEAGLVAIWLGLGQSSPLMRVVGAGAAYLVLASAYLSGVLWRVSYDDEQIRAENLDEQMAVILVVFILLFVAAFPLWLLRLLFGWNIGIEDTPAKSPGDFRQYSIGSLMLFTAMTGLLLGVGQQAGRFSGTDSLEFWGQMLGGSLGFIIPSAATLIPAALLLSHSPRVGFGVLLGILASIYGIVVWSLMSFTPGDSAVDLAEIGFSACPFLGFVLTLSLPLMGVRRCGYLLVVGEKGSEEK